jgi:hypothetical protein
MGGESLPLASAECHSRRLSSLDGDDRESPFGFRYPFKWALNRRARNAPAKKAAAKMQQL